MPKPTTRQQLLAQSQAEFDALEKLLVSFDPAACEQPGVMGDWSVKDVLAHLHEWQQMFFGWYQAGLRGETPPLPGRGYKWNQLAALNHEIYLAYRDSPLDEVVGKWRTSHRQMLDLVQSLPEEDLFTPARFAWTGKHNLAGFISANTGDHYRWAREGLRKALKR